MGSDVLSVTLGLLMAAAAPPDTGAALPRAFDPNEVLAKTRAAYAALASYADSGTVLDDAGGFTDHSTFRTRFTRAPRNLLIEFRAIASEYASGHRLPLNTHLVFWMENGELQTWSKKTQAHESYPADGGQQVNALRNAGYSTAGISTLIPSHLYRQSGLPSPVHATEEAEADGYETVNGRRCFRINGVERWRYPNGRVTGVRAITLWIDAETYLIHRVLQDTPKGMPHGSISRRTTTIKHQANPKLDPSLFRFTVPAN